MLRILIQFAVVLLVTMISHARAAEPSSIVINELTPKGQLRAAINYRNTALAQRDPTTGKLSGISVEIAKELARRLGRPIELVAYDSAGKVTDALNSDGWDVAFLARDPVRAVGIAFSPPYVLIEGGYIVLQSSAINDASQIDRDGVRVGISRGAAYDLFLSRELKSAKIKRSEATNEQLEWLARGEIDAIAGIKPTLMLMAKSSSNLRVLNGRFQVIEQAVAVPKSRVAGAAYLVGFIEELKASGFVAQALRDSKQAEAIVAPPATP